MRLDSLLGPLLSDAHVASYDMDIEKLTHAYIGTLRADALAMPVHWYYDRAALDRDYGAVDRYHQPREPHPDSILWRSQYKVSAPEYDILGSQKKRWGQRNIHYHRDLKAGENTLNFQLARKLYEWVCQRGGYDEDLWLEVYRDFMIHPEQHRDTYVEEYHRNFFESLAKGKQLRKCASVDIHIGGLASVAALTAALVKNGTTTVSEVQKTVQSHVCLTHLGSQVKEASGVLVRLLFRLANDEPLEEALRLEANGLVGLRQLKAWENLPDRQVIGSILSPACYLPESMIASLYLVWKYRGQFALGLQANAEAGGDNCHRGAVVGALLGALGPMPKIDF